VIAYLAYREITFGGKLKKLLGVLDLGLDELERTETETIKENKDKIM